MNFEQLITNPKLSASIKTLGYSTPTPIQIQAIPPVLAGKDVVGLAQTGTGKTAAFMLPILQRLGGPVGKTPRVLVVAPTRELSDQILQATHTFSATMGIRSVAVYGGVSFNPQVDRLRAGVDIIVACPGRLLDHMQQGTVDLRAIQVLVLDEADHMFDMGFLPNVRRIVRALPKNRQTLLFSATMPPDIRKLANEILTDPETVQVDRVRPADSVSHAIFQIDAAHKTPLLMALLEKTDAESVLIFTKTKQRTKRLAQHLEGKYRVSSLQGNLSQNRRKESIDGFRSGKYQIMVATDIAARGIDISTISHVINYDIPDTVEAYTHRIGRTGRASRTGDSFTFVTPEDHAMVRMIERSLGAPVPRIPIEGLEEVLAANKHEPLPSARQRRSFGSGGRGRGRPQQHSAGASTVERGGASGEYGLPNGGRPNGRGGPVGRGRSGASRGPSIGGRNRGPRRP